ncbi:hypothetical protein GO491_02775 [Flavobacteriaceae bacterium Ap0902]|nr:hypothetical protein [Flavobacteriaceae bacterium Ap0902]
MKNWILILLFCWAPLAIAQPKLKDFTAYYLFNVGYTYHNINYLEGGLNTYLVQRNNNILDLGATVNLAYTDDHLVAIPEAQVGYLFNKENTVIDPYSRNFKSAFWVARTSISPWHITPEVGITVISLIDITAGYGFEFREHDYVDLDGFKAGVSLRLPFLLFWHD